MEVKSSTTPKVEDLGSIDAWELGFNKTYRQGEPQVWEEMAKNQANQIFINVSQSLSEKTIKNRKRKATERAKQNRRKSKYTRADNSQKAKGLQSS